MRQSKSTKRTRSTSKKSAGWAHRARWYVIANRVSAVIYAIGRDQKFHFVDRLNNKKGDWSESDLVSDRPGRAASSAGAGTIRHGLDKRLSRHEQIASRFANRIARTLEDAYRQKRFKDLVLVAEPHFLGLLRRSLSLTLQRIVEHEVHREYSRGSEAEVQSHVLTAIGGA